METAIQENATSETTLISEENRLVREVLAEGLRETMELTVTPQSNVFWIERRGVVHYYNRETKSLPKSPV